MVESTAATSVSADLPALDPHDPRSQWERFQQLLWFDEELGAWLDLSRMALTGSELDDFKARMIPAFAAMKALEAGSIANADERRQVGHYWLRTPELAPDPQVTTHVRAEVERIETFSREVLAGTIRTAAGLPFTDVLWIGIGGSGLGPLLMVKALQKPGEGLRFHFFDNVDPDGISRTLATIGSRLLTTLVIVVSKSGGTPEPHLGMQQARRAVEDCGGGWAAQAVAVTMQGSKLDQLASSQGWLARFDLPDWVGGRTSITGAVGLLPGALVGADIQGFLAGAAAMDVRTRVQDLASNPAALLAAAWYSAGDGKGKRDMVVLPYRDSLELFSRYLQQLVMESLGKARDRDGRTVHQGIAVYGNKGSTDQHAYVQQLRDGIDNFFVTFIEVLEDPEDVPSVDGEHPADFLDGFLQGTRAALMESGRQSLSITLRRLDARSLGSLIALFERAVGFYGELVNINAYHQPGVEAGKKAAAGILSLQGELEAVLADGTPQSLSELQQRLNLPSPEPLFWILRHLCANPRGIRGEGSWGDPLSLKFRRS